MLLHRLRALWLERVMDEAENRSVEPMDASKTALFRRLVKEIRACDDAYYGEEPVPRIRDEEYDELIVHLIELERVYPELAAEDSPSRVVGHAAATKATVDARGLLGPISTGTVMAQRFPPYRHVARMLSLGNAYTPEDIRAFMARAEKAADDGRGVDEAQVEYCVEAKVDGVALGLAYRKGRLVRAATRGDGVVGDDITENVRAALVGRGVPDVLPEEVDVDVRGEVYISPEDFEALDVLDFGRLANARNAAAGGLKNKDPQEAAKRLLRFVAYECLSIPEEFAAEAAAEDGFKRPTGSARADENAWNASADERLDIVKPVWPTQVETLEGLGAWGFGAMNVFALCRSEEEVSLFAGQKERERASLGFEADGVVIKVNSSALRHDMGNTAKSPRGAIALKFSAVSAETAVKSVSYQVSRTGTITPVANLDPVALGGVTIRRATLHNFDEIKRLGVAVGDTVVVARGGDVIPKITKVLESAGGASEEKKIIPIPKLCPCCASEVQVAQLPNGSTTVACGNSSECSSQSLGRILHFCRRDAMDISGLGTKTVRKLLDSGFIESPADLFGLSLESLEKLPGFAERSAANLHAAIQDAARNRSLERVIIGLGIPGVGSTSARALALHVGSLEKLPNLVSDEGQTLMQLPNVAEKSAESIRSYLANPRVVAEVKALAEFVQPYAVVEEPDRVNAEKKDTSSGLAENVEPSFEDKTFAFTGSMNFLVRPAAAKLIRELGGKTVSMVSKKTSYLVVGDKPGLKYQKALRLGVKLLSEDDFLALFPDGTLKDRNLIAEPKGASEAVEVVTERTEAMTPSS